MKKLLLIFLLLPLLVRGAEIITVTVTVTNAPIGNTNTLVLNGNTRTFTNTITASPGTLIQETNSRPYSATNIINHLTLYTFGAGFNYRQTSPTNVLIVGTPATAMAASLAGAWGTISYSTQSIATPTYTVRVPHTNEAAAVRTNIASGLANYLNLSTNAIATNATALSNVVHKGAGPQQVIRTSLQVTQLNGMVSALTNGYYTNATFDRPKATNVFVYGGLQSLGSGVSSTVIGSNASAGYIRTVSVGVDASAGGPEATVVGYAAIADTNATALGRTTYATNGGTAVGTASAARGQNSIAISGAAEGIASLAMLGAEVFADNAIGIGASVDISTAGTNTIVIGAQSSSSHSNSVVIGAYASSTASNQIRLGTSLHTVNIPGALHVDGVATQLVHIGTMTIRGSSVYPPTTITSVAAGNNRIDATNGIIRATGTPGASWTLVGMSGGTDGRVVTLYNDTGYTLTIANESGTEATATYRIRTMAGADYVSGTNSVQEFFYDGNRNRWIMKFSNP